MARQGDTTPIGIGAFMFTAQRAEDRLMTKMVKEGSRKGVTPFGKLADTLKRPPTWAAMTGALAMAGPRTRRAAGRGSVCYLAAALAHLPIKALVGRKHPPRSSKVARIGPITSSFPSGHTASQLAFSLGAAQEAPLLFLPFYAATAASEWSLIRARSHYPTDMIAGGVLAVGVATAAWKLWPPRRSAEPDRAGSQSQEPAGRPPVDGADADLSSAGADLSQPRS